MALMCSRLTTTARSRPSKVEGHESCGSRRRRSRPGSPVRRMMACFPASTTRASPAASTASHARGPAPFFLADVARIRAPPESVGSGSPAAGDGRKAFLIFSPPQCEMTPKASRGQINDAGVSRFGQAGIPSKRLRPEACGSSGNYTIIKIGGQDIHELQRSKCSKAGR